MANTQKASPADRFQVTRSVIKWHLTQRLVRGPAQPGGDEPAESLAHAFRLEVTKPAGDKAKAAPGGKAS